MRTFFSLLAVLFSLQLSAQTRLQQLRCEMLSNPQGIDVAQPRFSWQLISQERNVQQTHYQVLVSSSKAALAANKADVWNSGKVAGSQSIHIRYNGAALQSGSRYYWKNTGLDKQEQQSIYVIIRI
jgi:hypothetical protein